MKSRILKYVRTVVFVIVIVVLINCIDFMMMPSGYIRYIIHVVDNPNTIEGYDCLVLGASHGRTSINPQYLIDSGYAENPLNLCIPGESVVNSYYLLKEASRNNDIKKVILEMDYQYWINDDARDSEFGDLFEYVQLPMSKAKLEYITNELLKKDFRTVYFKKIAYTYDFSKIKDNISVKLSKAYWDYDIKAAEIHDADGPYKGRGFFYREVVNTEKNDFWVCEWSRDNVSDKVIKYYDKIVDFCIENNIELVCVTEPITPTAVIRGPSSEANNYFKELCEERKVKYLDFTLIKEDVLSITDEDFCDWEGHMYGSLAEKFSEVLSEVLINNHKDFFHNNYDEKKMEICKK